MSRQKKYTLESLKEAVQHSYSYRGVLRYLGYNPNSGSFNERVKQDIIKNEIDISHFTGKLWHKNKTFLEDDRISHKSNIDKIFCKNSTYSTKYLRTLIFKNHLIEYKCTICGITQWNNKEIVLDLDHIDGDIYNNELANLRFLCPNCHSQTSTYKNKSNTRRIINYSDQDILNAIKVTPNIRQTLILLGLSNKGENYNTIRRIMNKYNISYNC